MSDIKSDGRCLPCSGLKSRDWKSWNDLQPPLPNMFHLMGEVLAPNPGVEVFLAAAEPQGFNPEVLLMDLYLIQRPGVWPDRQVWVRARYEKPIGATGYTDADLRCDGTSIASVDVQNVH